MDSVWQHAVRIVIGGMSFMLWLVAILGAAIIGRAVGGNLGARLAAGAMSLAVAWALGTLLIAYLDDEEHTDA